MADYDVLIAGAGMAGLTAGLFSARHGRSALVLGGIPGGALLSITRIDDFPGFTEGIAGYDLGPMLQEQAAAAGAAFGMAELDSLERSGQAWSGTTSEGETVTASSVVVATGTRPRATGAVGEERFAGAGISHCASCDGPLHAGKTVAVVGGGDSALFEALELGEFAERVVVVHRGPEWRAQAVYRERAEQSPKLELRLGVVVEELLGAETLSGIRLHDASGVEDVVDVSGLFVFVGGDPGVAFLAGFDVADEHGHVVTDASMRTTVPGLFAAGSVRSGFAGQAVTAAGDGAAAAVAADRYLTRLASAAPAGAPGA